MLATKSFVWLSLIFGNIFLSHDLVRAQAKEESIVIWFENEQVFRRFHKPEDLEKPFATWVDTTFEVSLTRHSKAKALLKKKKKSDVVKPQDLQEAFKPTYLLLVRPLYTSEKILSGEIELYANAKTPIDSVFFGGSQKDLAEVVFKKVEAMMAKRHLPLKCRIWGKPCNTVAHWGQAIMVSGAIIWKIVAPKNPIRPKLPDPKPLPDVP